MIGRLYMLVGLMQKHLLIGWGVVYQQNQNGNMLAEQVRLRHLIQVQT